MPISGLIITLDSNPVLADCAIASMASDANFELGERVGDRIAAVMCTGSERANKRAWRALNDLPGVRFVDVTSVHFDVLENEPTTTDRPVLSAGRIPQ